MRAPTLQRISIRPWALCIKIIARSDDQQVYKNVNVGEDHGEEYRLQPQWACADPPWNASYQKTQKSAAGMAWCKNAHADKLEDINLFGGIHREDMENWFLHMVFWSTLIFHIRQVYPLLKEWMNEWMNDILKTNHRELLKYQERNKASRMQKAWTLHTIAWRVHEHGHCGKQCGWSSKCYKYIYLPRDLCPTPG